MVLDDGWIVLIGDDDYKNFYLRILNRFGYLVVCIYWIGISILYLVDFVEFVDEIVIVDYFVMELVDY